MKLLLLALHHFLKPVTALIGLITISQAAPVLGEIHNVEVSACVRVVVQDSFPINEQSTFFNLKSGQVSRDDRPTIPPNAYLSPDGRAAVFLQAISETEIGMYLETFNSQQSILLDVTTSADLFSIAPNWDRPPWAWSPDSSHFVYVSQSQGKLSLTLVNKTGNFRMSQPISSANEQDTMLFFGWSADSAYIALAATELHIWSGLDLSHVGTGLAMTSGWTDEVNFMAWSPYGHRLAALLGNDPTKLDVWSPEHGVEASTPVTLDNEIFQLYWSPDEHALQLVSSTGHASYDEIFTLNRDVLLRVDIPNPWPGLIGWTKNGSAIVYMTNNTPAEPVTQRFTIDTRTRQTTIVDMPHMYVGDVSPDEHFMLLETQQGQTYRIEFAGIDGTNRKPFFEDTLPDNWNPPELTLYPPTVYWSTDSKYVAKEWYNAKHTGYQTFVGRPDKSDTQIIDGLVISWIEAHWLVYVDNQSKQMRVLIPESRSQFILEKALGKAPSISVSPDKSTLVETFENQTLLFASLIDSDQWAKSADLGNDVSFYDLEHSNTYPPPGIYSPQSLAWSSDSTMLAVTYAHSSDSNGELRVFSREGKLLFQTVFEIHPIGGGFAQLSVVWTPCA